MRIIVILIPWIVLALILKELTRYLGQTVICRVTVGDIVLCPLHGYNYTLLPWDVNNFFNFLLYSVVIYAITFMHIGDDSVIMIAAKLLCYDSSEMIIILIYR